MFVIVITCSPLFASAIPLAFNKKNHALSGRALFNASWLNQKREKLDLDISARYKYFLLDQFALDADISSTTTFIPEIRQSIALSSGLSYFFDTKTIVYPYAGLLGGLGYVLVATTNVPFLSIKPEIGMLLALSKHWALDLGLRSEFSFGIFLPPNITLTRIRLVTGYLGVTWFF